MTTATRHGDLQQPGRAQPTAKSRIGLIVALSMAAGLIAALVLVAMPFIPAKENVLTGVVLLAFALGWVLLAVLSTRFSDQPQRWAAAPAMFMAVAGLVSLSGSAAVQAGCGRQSCSGWLSGCSFGSGARCAAESDGGCCIPYWRC
jgi:FtsH-binding integral membrane protein